MARWLIIVGYEFLGGGWENCKSICKNLLECEDIRIKYSDSIRVSKDYTIVLVSAGKEINQKCYELLLENIKVGKSDEIIIFSHESREGHEAGSKASTLNNLKGTYRNLNFRLFRGTDLDEKKNYPFWLAMEINEWLKLNKDIPNWEVPEWEKLEEEVKKKSLIKPFTILKHRIAHLFLPLDIDLMGLEEVGNDKKKEYLEEILREKSKNKYKQKLLDLGFYICGISELSNEDGIIKPSVKSEKTIFQIAEERELDKNLLERLIEIAGIKKNNGNYAIDINSPIYNFVSLLDKKDVTNPTIGDVNDILNYFRKLGNGNGWIIKDANSYKIKSFHDWFCALMKCLDELKKILEEKDM